MLILVVSNVLYNDKASGSITQWQSSNLWVLELAESNSKALAVTDLILIRLQKVQDLLILYFCSFNKYTFCLFRDDFCHISNITIFLNL
jgi:hypothetical protein